MCPLAHMLCLGSGFFFQQDLVPDWKELSVVYKHDIAGVDFQAWS